MRGVVSGREILVSDIKPGDEVFFKQYDRFASGIVLAARAPLNFLAQPSEGEPPFLFLAEAQTAIVPPLIPADWVVDIRERPSQPLPIKRMEALAEGLGAEHEFFYSLEGQRRCASCAYREFLKRRESHVLELWAALLPEDELHRDLVLYQVRTMLEEPWDEPAKAAILYQLSLRLNREIPVMDIPMEVQHYPQHIEHRVEHGEKIATCGTCDRDVVLCGPKD